jgi:hypothetical protein
VLTASWTVTTLTKDKGRTAMMSATPIFEQLCRDFHDAGRSRPVDAPQQPIASQPKAPAHSLEDTGSARMYERSNYLPRALAEWACPTG